MCGISGIIAPHVPRGERERIVRGMMDRLAHRGPDGQGVYSGDGFTLGHRRLAILDLTEAAAQPMRCAQGRHVIVYNGEIYNFLELRQSLIQKGSAFRSFSDTEVLLTLLATAGDRALTQLNGMFAFCHVDEATGQWMLARDQFGIKPLYYANIEGGIVFASEIKALLVHPEVAARLDWASFQQYLTFQFCLGDRTLFAGIKKLEPSHYMTGRGVQVDAAPVCYWDASYAIDSHHTASYFRDHLLWLLEDSARLQIRSDVRIGAYLSGGLDSSVVASVAADHLGPGLPVFSGRFAEGPAYDESRYARAVADHIKGQYHDIVPTAEEFVDLLPGLIWSMDEPVAGPGLFPQAVVSRHAARHVKVVLGGQGGDELFGGYARYLIGYLEQALKGAIFETQEEGQHVVTFQSILPNLPLIREYVPLLRHFWKDGLFLDMDERYFRLIDRSPDADRFLSGDALAQLNRDEVFADFQAIFNHPGSESYFNKMTHFDQKTLLPALLQVEDRVSMAVSLESRVPLLDTRIAEMVASMPPGMKFAGGRTKHVFRDAITNLVPSAVQERKDKMGFPVPLIEWMRGGVVRDFVYDILTSKACRERGLFDPQRLDLLIGSNASFSRQLWGALCLELWHQAYIDG